MDCSTVVVELLLELLLDQAAMDYQTVAVPLLDLPLAAMGFQTVVEQTVVVEELPLAAAVSTAASCLLQQAVEADCSEGQTMGFPGSTEMPWLALEPEREPVVVPVSGVDCWHSTVLLEALLAWAGCYSMVLPVLMAAWAGWRSMVLLVLMTAWAGWAGCCSMVRVGCLLPLWADYCSMVPPAGFPELWAD
jgi:hypothetical protein